MFSRDFRRPKTAKTKIYFTFGAFGVALSLGRWSCPPVRRCAGFEASGPARVPALVAPVVCSLPFVPLLPLLSCNTGKICLVSQFKAVFSGFYMFGVGLLVLRALRGLWGFCTRV